MSNGDDILIGGEAWPVDFLELVKELGPEPEILFFECLLPSATSTLEHSLTMLVSVSSLDILLLKLPMPEVVVVDLPPDTNYLMWLFLLDSLQGYVTTPVSKCTSFSPITGYMV